MKYLIFNVLLFFFIGKCYGQNAGGCDIVGFKQMHWDAHTFPNDQIRDVDVLNRAFTYTGTLTIVSCSNCKYVKATVSGGLLTFTPTLDFKYLDRDLPQQSSQVALLYNDLTFSCNYGISTISFLQPITDTNNNAPVFTASSAAYQYRVASPLLMSGDVTSVGEQIIATDIDFSNQVMTFTIEPPDSRFVVQTVYLGNKQYRAAIIVTQVVTLFQDIQFTLRATDGGFPSKSVTTTVTITKTNDCSVSRAPTFSRVYYDFDYYELNGRAIISSRSGAIAVSSTSLQLIQVSIKGNGNFYVVYDQYSGQITLNVAQVVRNAGTTVIRLELTALEIGSSNSGSCTVLVNLPQPPKFSKPCYKGDYSVVSGRGQLVISERLSFAAQYQGTYTLRLSGELASYFQISLIGYDIFVTLVRDLDSAYLDREIEALITLEAILDSSDVGFGTLLIHLPRQAYPLPPTFSRSYYSARYINNYYSMDVVEVTTGPIQVNSNRPDDLIMIITGDYASYFGTKYLGNGVYQLFLLKNFEDDFLINNQYIIVFFEVFVMGVPGKGIAPVTIACPNQSTRASPLKTLLGIA